MGENEAFQCLSKRKKKKWKFTITLLLGMALPVESEIMCNFPFCIGTLARQEGNTIHLQVCTGCRTDCGHRGGIIYSSLTYKTTTEYVKQKHYMGCEEHQALFQLLKH